MPQFEYKTVPAVTRGQKEKGVKTPEARFALALEQQLNALAADGWEYCRAEMLPSTERAGLTGTTTEWRHILIFRRPAPELQMEALPAPDMVSEEPLEAAETPQEDATEQEDMPTENKTKTVD
ncbi:MAG: DUF4177 domain-containing protein [Pseudomonadota bacterium]